MPTWRLAWLVPAVILLVRPAWAASWCAIVETAGSDRTLVESVTALLERHGVATHVERCGVGGAHVFLDESPAAPSIMVSIRDSEGKEARRQIERDEKAAAVVASLVESFVLGEDTDLLFRPSKPIEAGAPAAAVSSHPLLQMSLLGGFLFGSDSSTWYGVQLDGCVRAAWSCLGVRTRLARDDNGGGVSSDLVRTEWDGLALLGVPFEGKRWQLLPAFALGVTYTRSSLFPAQFRVSVTDYDLRGQLSLGLALFLSTSWALRLDLAAEATKDLSHTSRQQSLSLGSLLVSLVPEPPAQSAWLALGLECRL